MTLVMVISQTEIADTCPCVLIRVIFTYLFNLTPPLLTVDPPIIVTQPQDKLNVIPGSNATFMVAATGLRLNYTWKQRDGSALRICDKFMPSNKTLTIRNVLPSDVGSYCCVVSNTAGSITSNSASLTLSELYIYTGSLDATTMYNLYGMHKCYLFCILNYANFNLFISVTEDKLL